MRKVDTQLIEDTLFRLASAAGRSLTPDCRAALLAAREKEEGAARFALDTVIENGEIAAREGMPVCQDTGMSVVFIRLGQEVSLVGKPLFEAVNNGIRRAYADFRKSICDPLTRQNTGDNTPANLHVEIVEGDRIEIDYLPKGFGSENMSKLAMLTPAEGREGIVKTVVEAVKAAGSRPCPPVYVGVGIGGSFDSCALLAKKALLREIGSRNPRKDVAELEEELLSRINGTGIGAQGFGGTVTALGVSAEIAPTHIAGLPVAVNMQCHCVRHEKEIL